MDPLNDDAYIIQPAVVGWSASRNSLPPEKAEHLKAVVERMFGIKRKPPSTMQCSIHMASVGPNTEYEIAVGELPDALRDIAAKVEQMDKHTRIEGVTVAVSEEFAPSWQVQVFFRR